MMVWLVQLIEKRFNTRMRHFCVGENPRFLLNGLIYKFFLAISFVFAPLLSYAAPMNGPSTAQLAEILQNISHQLVAIQGQNQQNWNKFFEQSVSQRYSPSDYPAWRNMQSEMNDLQGSLSDANFASMAGVNLYNPKLSGQASNVDINSVKLAGSVIQQIGSEKNRNLANLVKLPLSQNWHQGLAGASAVQVLKALSAQVALGNALKYQALQNQKNNQLLLSRVLVELTQLNQNLVKLQGK